MARKLLKKNFDETPYKVGEKSLPERIYEFIKGAKKPKYSDIQIKFGDSGRVGHSIRLLKSTGKIEKKFFECGRCWYWVIKK